MTKKKKLYAGCKFMKGKVPTSEKGEKEAMPDHFRFAITWGFYRNRKHYEDECYKKKISQSD